MLQKVSHRILDRNFIDNPPLSPCQLEVDGLVEGFIHHATDWKTLAAMTAGGMAYRLGRIGTLPVGVQNFEPLRRIASLGIGLTAEVAAYELTSRGLQPGFPSLWRWDSPGGLKEGLLSSLVSFGTLKGFGKLTQGQNFILQHGVQDFAMVLGHQLAFQAGIGPRPDGTLPEQLLRAETTNLQMSAGMALAHRLAPGISAWERGMDLRFSEILPTLRTNKDFAFASTGGPRSPSIIMETKGLGKHFLSEMSEIKKEPTDQNSSPLESVGTTPLASESNFEIPKELVERLRKARRVTVLTGAGLSAESGIPTFRDGTSALWTNVSMDEVATAKAFAKNPAKVWRWHAEQFKQLLHARPNPAHFALAEMEREVPEFTLITQNIDGLHQEAGSKYVIELHGNLHRARCVQENRPVESWEEKDETPPRCPHCAGPLRHDVVWFGEQLSPESLGAAIDASHHSEVFLSIGTSSVVNPAAALARRAVRTGQTVIEINPHETPLSRSATFVLRGPAGKILPALVDAVWRNPPPTAEESAKKLAARFRPLFPATYRKKIIEAALNTEGRQPFFKERLLEAYAQDPNRGTFKKLMTVLAIQDLFHGDATASSLGSFDGVLLQTLIRRSAADGDESRRGEAFQAIFQAMEDGLSRKTFEELFERFGYGKDLGLSESPLYPATFAQLHESSARRLWKDYRDQDIIPLLNLVYESAPTDPVKSRRLIRILSQARHSPLYDPGQIDAVLDHARRHPFGKPMLKRMLQVFIVEDGAGKLRDLIEDGQKTDSIGVIMNFREEGLFPEEIARRINGTHHTAYLDDLRLARKVVSTLWDIGSSLQDFSGRPKNLSRIRHLVADLLDSGGELTPTFWFKLMGDDPEAGRSSPLTEKMKVMVREGRLHLPVVSDTAFEAITNKSPALKGCELLFFLQADREGDPHEIVIRALPPFDRGTLEGKNSAFHQILRRVKGLSHEGAHLLQAIGEDESNVHGALPFDFGSIDRNERLSSEIMASLDQTRWDVKNTDIEFWIRSQRLGLNLPLYFLHINDQNYYGEANEYLVGKLTE